MADQQLLLNHVAGAMVDNLTSRIRDLTYTVTDEVHSGMGYSLFEFAIDRAVADIATLPAAVRPTFEVDLYTRMVTHNPHVQALCKTHGLTPVTMPRWNGPSPLAAHAALGNLRDLVRAKSVRSTQTLDKELAKTKGTQSWSKFAHQWIEAYTARHGGAPKPADLVAKLVQALPSKHHTAVMATCAGTMMNPDIGLGFYIEFFKTFDELQGSPSEAVPTSVNPNAMQIDHVATFQMAVAAADQQWAALQEAAARGDHVMVAQIRAGLTCFYCHQLGHVVAECPKKTEEEEKAKREAQKDKAKALAKQAARFQKKGKGSGSQ